MKYANAYGTLKSHVENVLRCCRESDLEDSVLIFKSHIENLQKAYDELHDEYGILKEFEAVDRAEANFKEATRTDK